MSSVQQMVPLQFNALTDISEVPEISVGDEACLAELREVLERHSRVDRFGIALLHKHFELKEGEILLEFCDKEGRRLVTKPVEQSTVKDVPLIKTLWRFDDGTASACVPFCPTGPDGSHYGYKDHW